MLQLHSYMCLSKSYVIGRSSAPESTVIFEQSGGTVESVGGFYMYENDEISLKEGTNNGNARGNGGTGSIKIKDGTWNGQLAHIKAIYRLNSTAILFKNSSRILSIRRPTNNVRTCCYISLIVYNKCVI